MEIAVRRNSSETYTTLNPSQQIVSSPYAVKALSAQQADVALDQVVTVNETIDNLNFSSVP